MAVVFISPKQRQRTFFVAITIVFLLFWAVVSFSIFFSKATDSLPKLVFNPTKINIDTSIFSSAQFQGLLPLGEINKRFSYKAITRDGKVESGFVSAETKVLAMQILATKGLNVSEIKEVNAGRDNPFIPYYQQTVTAGTTQNKNLTTGK